MINRLLKTTGDDDFFDTSGWGCDVPALPSADNPCEASGGSSDGRVLLSFDNQNTGTSGFVRHGHTKDKAGLEDVLDGAKVNKNELLAKAGVNFEGKGGFLDDMRRYIEEALKDTRVLSYVSVITSDRQTERLPELAGLTWVSPMRLPPNHHLFSQALEQFPFLNSNSSHTITPEVRSIGAVVVHADLRRRSIADFMYLAMLEEMSKIGVQHLTFEIYHLLARVRVGVEECIGDKTRSSQSMQADISDKIDFDGGILDQQNVPSTAMHQGLGARQIGWVADAPKLIPGDGESSGDQLTHFLSRLYIMNVEEALSKLRQKLAGKFDLEVDSAD